MSGGRSRWAGRLRLGLAFCFAAAVTAIELVAVARLGAPSAHPEAQSAEPHEPPPVILAPPPPSNPRPLLAPPRAERLVESAPALMRAPEPTPPALPALADLHPPTSDLAQDLPGLSIGAPGQPGARLDSGGALAKVPATPRRRPAPEYPRAARRDGIEGFVIVRLRVDETGRVVDAVVTEAVPPGVFDEAALRAARTYRYDPAQVAGRAVPDTLEQRIMFRLR